MYRFKLIAWALISLNLLGQEIPDYKAEYTYTNSKFSMDGIRELTTKEDGIRILKFEGKLPMGRIKISSNFVEVASGFFSSPDSVFIFFCDRGVSTTCSRKRFRLLAIIQNLCLWNRVFH